MTKKELLEEIENLYERFLSAKEGASMQSRNYEDAELETVDKDEGELNYIQALYFGAVEDGASLAMEQLIALKYRIERREDE